MTFDRCVVCGDIIPEGRQVCVNCESRTNPAAVEIRLTELVLDKILDLVKKGFKVSFQTAPEYPDFCKVLRIEVCKGDKHSVELVDIGDVTLRVTGQSVDQLISRYLRKVEWEFNYAFEKEKKNEI